MTSRHAPKTLWLVRHSDSGEELGCVDRTRNYDAEFGARVPFLFSCQRSAREAWIRTCLQEGYIEKGVSLGGPGQRHRYHPGPNYDLLPTVEYVRVLLVEEGFELSSKEDVRVEEKP